MQNWLLICLKIHLHVCDMHTFICNQLDGTCTCICYVASATLEVHAPPSNIGDLQAAEKACGN